MTVGVVLMAYGTPADIDAVKLMPRGFTAVNEPEKFDEVERP